MGGCTACCARPLAATRSPPHTAPPSLEKLEQLLAAYPNLAYVACNQTLDRLREKGGTVSLLPGVHVAPTALDEIVKRLQEGWVYIRA
mgnify:CR=1 FL=1